MSVKLAGTGVGYSIIASPNPVAVTTAGRAYRASAYVRSSTGKRVCLRLREWAGSTVIGSRETCVNPSAQWTPFPTVLYSAVGGGSIDLYAYQSPAVAGDAFLLDKVELTT